MLYAQGGHSLPTEDATLEDMLEMEETDASQHLSTTEAGGWRAAAANLCGVPDKPTPQFPLSRIDLLSTPRATTMDGYVSVQAPGAGNLTCRLLTAERLAMLSRHTRSQLLHYACLLPPPAGCPPEQAHSTSQVEAAVRAARRVSRWATKAGSFVGHKVKPMSEAAQGQQQQLFLVVDHVGLKAAAALGCISTSEVVRWLRWHLATPASSAPHVSDTGTTHLSDTSRTLLVAAAAGFPFASASLLGPTTSMEAEPKASSNSKLPTFQWRGPSSALSQSAAGCAVAVSAAYVDAGDGSLQASLVLTPSRHALLDATQPPRAA